MKTNIEIIEGHIDDLLILIRQAGECILNYYQQPIDIETKDDNSPVTIADQLADKIIHEGLSKLFPYSIVSEEGIIPSKIDKEFWLVDPLDGTKEFIYHSDQFTVNIAFVERGASIFGIIYVPVSKVCYFTYKGQAYCQEMGKDPQPIYMRPMPKDNIIVLESRYHKFRGDFSDFLDLPSYKAKPVGSSLKMCLLAEGEADFHIRLGKTMEWDTAAGQAIVEAAGGKIIDFDMKPLKYGKSDFINSEFIICHRDFQIKKKKA